MTISTITSKGQTTIPKEVRDYLELAPQTRVAFERKDGYVIMRPLHSNLDDFAGILPTKKPAGTKTAERRSVAAMLARKHELS